MIEKEEIDAIIQGYQKDRIAVGTLGSHSALNIFKGAREEGLKTVCICRKKDEIVYRRFPLADDIILVDDFSRLLDEDLQERLRRLNVILVPHGSFNAYLSMEDMLNKLYVPMFGNRRLLSWEVDRERQRIWLQRAGLKLPKIFEDPNEIDRLVIVKFPGARGGKGYFLANSPDSFKEKIESMIRKGHLRREDASRVYIQEYVVGVNIYFQYFRSILQDEVELLGMDKRYESTVDSIGRIPASEQLEIDLNPTYTIVGNIPVTLRESLLPEVLRMGDNVVKVSEEIAPPGIIGPFCLETIITDRLEVFTFEISARIVAGSNVGIGTSPYAYLKYGEEMYMGRRIAREIKLGIERGELEKIVY
ncbi:MAG TPA: formate--phosphoribosylaminoimidazolecarboxamide ligase [Candidatus Bathyarchaeota archaeon]|nr:formate--phosphoribosylaminoimidazolecarboxamide ligase [Candidatus Bathyarchaeota archaeon]